MLQKSEQTFIFPLLNIHDLLKLRRELFAAKTCHRNLASVMRGKTGIELGQRIMVPAADTTHIKSFFATKEKHSFYIFDFYTF